MSLGISLQNALSGLGVATKSTEVISSNIANALTPGYAKRGLAVSSLMTGGVTVDAVQRTDNPAITNERRSAQADISHIEEVQKFWDRLFSEVGEFDGEFGLQNDITRMVDTLMIATSAPSDPSRLSQFFDAANSFVNRFQNISRQLQEQRYLADRSIAQSVTKLNASLKQIEKISAQLSQVAANTSEHANLLDMRSRALDDISSLVPIRVLERSDGSFSVYTQNGLGLLEGRAIQLEYAPSGLIGPYQHLDLRLVPAA